MFTMIIVDDERYVIDGLLKFVDWSGIGIEVADTALNGEDGAEKIRQKNPDIVMTDISMPVMDGIEMIKVINNEGIKPKIVILTGYSEFEYAREAMKYGAADYILKPSMPDEISETMKKVVNICKEERVRQEQERHIREQLKQSMPAMIEKFLEELFEGSIKSEQVLKEKTDFLGLDFCNKSFRVLTLQIDSYDSFMERFKEIDRQFVKFSILTMACDHLGVKNTYLNFKEKNSNILLTDMEEAHNQIDDEQITEKLTELIERCRRMYGISISIGLGEQVCELSRIRESYQQSRESLKYKMYFGNGKVIFYADIIHTQLVTPVLQLYDRNMLIDGLKMRSLPMVLECIDDMFAKIRSQGCVRFDYLKTALFEMMGTVSLTLYQIGEKMPHDFVNGKTPWDVIENKGTVDEIQNYLKDFFQIILSATGQKVNQRNARIVEQIIDYIKENYDKNISLNELSKRIYLTPNYMSNIFSQQAGHNFMDHLAQYRIEKAKELINQGKYKIYQIGEMVGYKNPDYFRKIFREYTGVSPSEYAK
ncbi:MAG: response regulator [Clostridiaceae bacterium]